MDSGAPRVSQIGLEQPGSPGLGTSNLEDGVAVEVAVAEGVLGSDKDVGDGEYFQWWSQEVLLWGATININHISKQQKI